MSSMQPINETPVDAGIAKPLNTVRTLMFVQGGLAILSALLLIMAGGAAASRRTAAETAELQRQAEQASGGARLLGLLLFVVWIGVLVALFVLPNKVRRGSPKARTWALIVEGAIIAQGLLSVVRNPGPFTIGVFVLFNLALPVAVITLLMSADAKKAVASTAQGDMSARFDVRNMPTL